MLYSSLYPFFNTALYFNIILVSVSSLIIGFFYFNPPKKRVIRLLVGLVSVILGLVIVIISVLGILSFSIYVVGLDSEGTPASVMDLNSIFVLFIFVGVCFILHGVLKIKKRAIAPDGNVHGDQ